ncbi:hypothetical protein JX265_007775 [Neoarthrinium moseri]|uniref:Uncharacterized protein n=1 Tax=Neoarthrinium moseri TaxID=1658444 RepID=A0A9P9WJD4_9PEZI|nr:hypothetical protein JX265_007775 [Neoarthrinium moseri]
MFSSNRPRNVLRRKSNNLPRPIWVGRPADDFRPATANAVSMIPLHSSSHGPVDLKIMGPSQTVNTAVLMELFGSRIFSFKAVRIQLLWASDTAQRAHVLWTFSTDWEARQAKLALKERFAEVLSWLVDEDGCAVA